MIKIIKHGKHKMTQITCPKCGCVFEYSPDEVKERTDGDPWDPIMWDEITCPECSCVIQID